MKRERKAHTNITVEEPDEEPTQHICANKCIAEEVNVKPALSATGWQGEESYGDLLPSLSLRATGNRNWDVESNISRSINSAFERMNQLFDKDSQPDIKVFSSSTTRRVDPSGKVYEQVTLTTRYKEASQVVGYKKNEFTEEEEVFNHRQIGQRGREVKHIREPKNHVYRVCDNYLNCTPEDSDSFENEWQSHTEAQYSIPIRFLDHDE